MFTLVIGGAASGKSAYAEQLIVAAGNKPRTYIATMQPFDDECRARIQKHRMMRQEKGFETIECYTDLAVLEGKLPKGGAVLLECLSNLAANERYSPEGAGERALEAMIKGVQRGVLRRQ
jgi:adenosylcobinamide kinase/adenosylcobinamide-phosphate guanylyltransferase